MRLFSNPSPKTFSLLSIGQRGVGKTVFLAGSYAELQGNAFQLDGTRPQSCWFECLDVDVQTNLERILYHVQQTGLYPPATIKITSFNFSLKQQTLSGIKTLCKFRWWDIPGESCNIRNPDFQEIVLSSQACCVFINARALVHDREYAQSLEDIFNQVVAIASLVNQHQLNYAFAIVLTQCDLLETGSVTQLQVEQNIQPLMVRLDAIKANYHRFYSAIPIVSMGGVSSLNARGAADPLLWLLAQLNKHYHFQPQRNLATGLTQNLFVQQILPPQLRRYVVILAIASLAILGVSVAVMISAGLFNPPHLPVKQSTQNF
jgi:GTPase SAR1 family protein